MTAFSCHQSTECDFRVIQVPTGKSFHNFMTSYFCVTAKNCLPTVRSCLLSKGVIRSLYLLHWVSLLVLHLNLSSFLMNRTKEKLIAPFLIIFISECTYDPLFDSNLAI